jgi:hypothetical protein
MVPKRRIAAGLTGVALALIVAGVAAVVLVARSGGGGTPTGGAGTTTPHPASPSGTFPGTPSLSAYPSVSPSGSSTPVVTTSANAAPSPSQGTIGFAKVGALLVYIAEDGTVIPVPSVDGLQVVVQKNKAVYQAVASNRYGLKAGAYAGQFVPLVATGQQDGSSAETGGVVLVGPVVSRLISDQLASTKSANSRWIVALPVDIRASTAAVQVSFDDFGTVGSGNAPRVQVRFSGSLPVDEMIPANAGYHVLVEGLGPTVWQIIDPTRLSLPTDAVDPTHAMNELVIYGNVPPTTRGSVIRRDVYHDTKVAVGQTMLMATNSVSVSLAVAGSHLDIGPDRILSIGDVPVFVVSS